MESWVSERRYWRSLDFIIMIVRLLLLIKIIVLV